MCERPHGVDPGQGEGQTEGGPLGHVPSPPRLRHGEGAGHVLCRGPEDLQLLQPGQGRPQPNSLQGRKLLPGHQRSHSLSLNVMSVAVGEWHCALSDDLIELCLYAIFKTDESRVRVCLLTQQPALQ